MKMHKRKNLSNIDVFFDIDGCLLDRNYHVIGEAANINKTIQEAKNQGLNLHLNSNRSLQSILEIRENLGFNGKIIYENGIGIYNPEKKITEKSNFEKFNKNSLEKFLKNLDYEVIFTNTDDVIRKTNTIKELFMQDKEYVFCETSREYTMTLYPRQNKNNDIISVDISQLTNILIEKYIKYETKSNYKYENIIMIPLGANKGSSLRKLGENNKIASFGDEPADIYMFEKSSIIGCPANADKEVKTYVSNRNGFVSNKKYTEGSIEFIEYILSIKQ